MLLLGNPCHLYNVCKVLAATIWYLIISCSYLGAAWEREKTVDGWAALLLGHIAVK